MADITLSAGVRQNLLSLQNTADLMAQTQNRLATGKKVNSALDNPISYFTSQSLNNRASDLNSLLDSISNATQTLDAANNGLTSLTKLVQSAQAIAQQALQSASTTAKVTGSVTGQTASTDISGITATKTITVSDGTTTATYTAAASDTVQDFLDAVNNASGLKVNASLDASGAIKLEATDGSTITVGGTGSAADLAVIGLTAGATTGSLNAGRTSLANQFDDIRSQISQLSADSGYNGVNLLNGDSLQVVFNETGTSTQSITGVKFDAAGLGIAASSNSFQTDSDVNAALSDLTSALGTLRSQSVAFGSSLSVVQTRQDFTKSMVNTLQTGADNLVLADTNLEGANMLALQTRQSLSTTALSLAAQASQSVLRLFG
ncbi:MAG TPA: flagellin [Pseudolabrys sp.]|nr:flagellin [Pseudolabrys sp.]